MPLVSTPFSSYPLPGFRLIRIFGLWSSMVCMNSSQKGRPLYLAPGALMNYLCQSIGASHASQKLNSLLVCKLRDRKGRATRNAEKQSSFAMFARDLQNSFIDKFEIARVTEMAVSRRPSRRWWIFLSIYSRSAQIALQIFDLWWQLLFVWLVSPQVFVGSKCHKCLAVWG